MLTSFVHFIVHNNFQIHNYARFLHCRDIFIEPASFKTPKSLGYCTLQLNLLYFLKFNKLNYIIKFKHIHIITSTKNCFAFVGFSFENPTTVKQLVCLLDRPSFPQFLVESLLFFFLSFFVYACYGRPSREMGEVVAQYKGNLDGKPFY